MAPRSKIQKASSNQIKKPFALKIPKCSPEHMLREAGVAPVWQPQINETCKSENKYTAQVRLPNVDFRRPWNDNVPQVTIPQHVNAEDKGTTITPDSVKLAKPEVTTEVKSADTPSFTFIQIETNLPTNPPTKPPPPKVRFSPSELDHAVIKTARQPLSRGTRGRGDSRNAFMRRERGATSISGMNVSAIGSQSAPRPATSAQRRLQSNTNPTGFRASSSSSAKAKSMLRRPTPLAQRSFTSPYHQIQPHGAVLRRPGDWKTWVVLSVKVFDLPPDITTYNLSRIFSREGSILSIEILEDSRGIREGRAIIKFSPPPNRPFWQAEQYPIYDDGTAARYARVVMELPRRSFQAPSPVNPLVTFPEILDLYAETLDFGFMYDQQSIMGMYKVKSTPSAGTKFHLDLFRREIAVELQVLLQDISQSPKLGKRIRTETFQFLLPFSQLQKIHQIQAEENKVVLVISLETPPRFFRKLPDAKTHEENAKYWSRNNSWYRQTDIVYDRSGLKLSPLTLKKTKPIIDIGRWTTYRFTFDMQKNSTDKFELMCQALKDYNVHVVPVQNMNLITDCEPAVWEYIDKPSVKQKTTGNPLDELIEDTVQTLAFPVRFQLEVCISQGCLNEHNLTQTFVKKLMETEVTKAQDLLEYVANQKKRIYNPMEIFDMTIIKGSASRSKIPHYCVYTRSATITPTMVYYNTPTIETSNRVIRQYAEYADRFLRVRFTDEKLEGRINPTDKDTMNEVFTRIKRTMINGVTVGDRKYDFLAFGNSQFREHGAYFFAPLPHLSAAAIRRWMGMFKDIKIVAKHAARLGQCFSTTRAISGTRVTVVEIEDIERNGSVFTDGVGKISAFLAQIAASELGITQSAAGPPSVYQFRLGGCKGVLAVSPEAKMREIHIRPSQYKFPAKHEGLEIIRWSQFASANLNRQIILVLSALGVSDEIFVDKLKMQLSNLERAMTDEKMALSLLQKDIDANQMTLTVAGMILDGFQRSREPFAISLLQLWRAWSIKYLKEKARITIYDGALLLGCVDETGTLKGHFDHVSGPSNHASIEEKTMALPQVFVRLSKGVDEKPHTVLGPMLLARNPSLHPGDIRLVCGVDVASLHHLVDVVVLPQTGDRAIAGMCSGGDLDGDDYLVLWDKELLPQEWSHEPMDYTPPEPVKVDREVTTDDITSFFVTYMKNDTLPRIAHAHVALADFMNAGVKDDKCLKLAALHSMAVDYVKTGVPAVMPRELAPRKWPHFMEKKHKPKDQIYESHKVLGQLYDQVERVDFIPAFSEPFDKRILDAYELDEKVLQEAAELKKEYDAAMHRVMAQHDIKTEFEVWSTFVLGHSNQSRDFKFHEEIGQLSSALKDQYRSVCYQKAGGKDFELIGPFVAAMYTITSDEMSLAVSECRKLRTVGGKKVSVSNMEPANMPLMSFPWLFQGVLGKIASGDHFMMQGKIDTSMRVLGQRKHVLPKKIRLDSESLGDEDILETAEGVTHRGEVLELFEKLIDYDDEGHDGFSGVTAKAKAVVTKSSSDTSTCESAGLSVDDLLFGDTVKEFPSLTTHNSKEYDNSEYGSGSLLDIEIEGDHFSNPVKSRKISVKSRKDELIHIDSDDTEEEDEDEEKDTVERKLKEDVSSEILLTSPQDGAEGSRKSSKAVEDLSELRNLGRLTESALALNLVGCPFRKPDEWATDESRKSDTAKATSPDLDVSGTLLPDRQRTKQSSPTDSRSQIGNANSEKVENSSLRSSLSLTGDLNNQEAKQSFSPPKSANSPESAEISGEVSEVNLEDEEEEEEEEEEEIVHMEMPSSLLDKLAKFSED